MVKRSLAAFLAIFLYVTVAFSYTFSWDNSGNICMGVCETYILIWEEPVYAGSCPSDQLIVSCIDGVCDTDKFVPPECDLDGKEKYRLRVLPAGWDTTQFQVRKSNAPDLEYGKKFISVVIACEDGACSDYSNRLVWKTPDKKIDPFGYKLK
jgi:hypothetical protein